MMIEDRIQVTDDASACIGVEYEYQSSGAVCIPAPADRRAAEGLKLQQMAPVHPSTAKTNGGIDPIYADLYDRLKAMASRQRLRGGAPRTLCTTELVHEAYLRMGESNFRYEQTAQFFAYAARAMRHILTDAARRRMQPKRGGDQARLMLSDPAVDSVLVDPHLALQLDEALVALEREDARAAQVVELHYFAGLDLQQVADTLQIARRTADRDWRYARAFLAARAGT
ncbi:MAG TPA: ECF-type sigma factor [Rudaea sp.]|jgi:RNA polymerase sigma factor (TIGR02999 family)|nr:ECF-type sigma factor [Rudaea sp.]